MKRLKYFRTGAAVIPEGTIETRSLRESSTYFNLMRISYVDWWKRGGS